MLFVEPLPQINQSATLRTKWHRDRDHRIEGLAASRTLNRFLLHSENDCGTKSPQDKSLSPRDMELLFRRLAVVLDLPFGIKSLVPIAEIDRPALHESLFYRRGDFENVTISHDQGGFFAG